MLPWIKKKTILGFHGLPEELDWIYYCKYLIHFTNFALFCSVFSLQQSDQEFSDLISSLIHSVSQFNIHILNICCIFLFYYNIYFYISIILQLFPAAAAGIQPSAGSDEDEEEEDRLQDRRSFDVNICR